MNRYFSIFLVVLVLLFTACDKDPENNYIDLLPGFWAQESIHIDDVPIPLSDCEQSSRILIEPNGIYRLYSSCDTQQRAGTWLISDNKILDLSMDRRNANSYYSFPVRFTITELTSTHLTIRIRTYVGERKRTVMFTPMESDDTTGMTAEELLELDRFNKTLKTYLYRFSKI